MSLFSHSAWGAEAVGVVQQTVEGVWLERDGEKQAVRIKEPLFMSDRLSTEAEGKVHILLYNGVLIAVGNNSSLGIEDATFDETSRSMPFTIALTSGVARFTLSEGPGSQEEFAVTTPAASIVMRGKVFGVEVSPSGVTDVIGLSIKPDTPSPVKNIQTGTIEYIDKNGLTVKASKVGSTRYMAPANRFSAISQAVAIAASQDAATEEGAEEQPQREDSAVNPTTDPIGESYRQFPPGSVPKEAPIEVLVQIPA